MEGGREEKGGEGRRGGGREGGGEAGGEGRRRRRGVAAIATYILSLALMVYLFYSSPIFRGDLWRAGIVWRQCGPATGYVS